jgi:hypothetical protein
MGLSREARIGIWVGLATTIALILIEPKQPAWRIVLLIALAVCAIVVVKDLNWVNQRTESLSIAQGEGLSQQLSIARLGFGIFVAISLVTVFGVITWPPAAAVEQEASHLLQAVLAPVSPEKAVGHAPPTPNGILPATTAQPATPKPKPKPAPAMPRQEEPKPTAPIPVPAQSESYPIIVVARTQVTRKTDTHQLGIVVALSSTTSAEANVHIVAQTWWVTNGVELATGPPLERDVGFAAVGFSYELSTNIPLTTTGETLYDNGSAFITVVGTASYPDRGGKTIYHFKGNTNFTLDHLDMVQSDYERVAEK